MVSIGELYTFTIHVHLLSLTWVEFEYFIDLVWQIRQIIIVGEKFNKPQNLLNLISCMLFICYQSLKKRSLRHGEFSNDDFTNISIKCN